MTTGKKLGLVALLVITTFCTAWIHAYRQSSTYFEFARAMHKQGELVIALKGMNKLEMRIDDEYFGGYQQVIETWESSVFGIRPAFYEQARVAALDILPNVSNGELLEFIDLYIQLDQRYVPEAAHELLKRSLQQGDEEQAAEMEEFMAEAFPEHAINEV
ncbi:hypothetical protein GZ77_12205 [Endozoicomonas montiporae]|uniref:Uncharacterized protein n=2 Tax=Endozoicomonas montiporae TaxID=1027273 RepID=A0A081N967_9GAMM|nr:hypothetical protein GZ77_12205 [Endozoicomonas montiporae]